MSDRVRLLVAGSALSLVLVLVIGATGVITPRGSVAYGASTTLTILTGEVLISRDGGPFEAALDGAILGPRDTVRTAEGGRAVLTYFEGSTVSLEPSSELRIDDAGSSPDGGTIVTMTQTIGKSWHAVTRLVIGSSQYEVRTPALTASVRGTSFAVGVETNDAGDLVTTVGTTEGSVATAAPPTPQDPVPAPVLVPAGFETSAKRGDARPETPKPKAEPERVVTVETSANTLVVDPHGRANGVTKDGRVVTQTPGARVTRNADGSVTVVLPDLPDGRIATVIEAATDRASRLPDQVRIVASVSERGRSATTTEDTVDTRGAGTQKIVSGFELRRSQTNTPSGVRALNTQEESDLRTEGVKAPPRPAVATPGARQGPRAAANDAAAPTPVADPSPTGRFVPAIPFVTAAPRRVEPTAGTAREAAGERTPEPTVARTPPPTPAPRKTNAAPPPTIAPTPRETSAIVPRLPAIAPQPHRPQATRR